MNQIKTAHPDPACLPLTETGDPLYMVPWPAVAASDMPLPNSRAALALEPSGDHSNPLANGLRAFANLFKGQKP